MDIIYEPQGAAREYSSLALNIYKGCEHACKYCFAPSALMIKRDRYNGDANPKKTILNRLKKDTQYLAKNNINDEILLSFIGDPYQPAETRYRFTRRVLEVLIEHNQPFTILTKGELRAEEDFDLLQSYKEKRFGTSLRFTEQHDADEWEPGAASVSDRITAIKHAHDRGIPTWVSLEPVIYEVAEITGRALSTLINERFLGKGIPYIKIGKSVRYKYEDVIEFMESNRVETFNV